MQTQRVILRVAHNYWAFPSLCQSASAKFHVLRKLDFEVKSSPVTNQHFVLRLFLIIGRKDGSMKTPVKASPGIFKRVI